MNKKIKKIIVYISITGGLLLMFYLIIASSFKMPNMVYGGENLRYYNTIKSISKTSGEINLKEVFKFEWDTAYIVSNPRLYGRELADMLGVECDLNPIEPPTPVLRIVFINKHQFVYDFKYDTNYIQFIPLGSYIYDSTAFSVTHNLFNPIVLEIKD